MPRLDSRDSKYSRQGFHGYQIYFGGMSCGGFWGFQGFPTLSEERFSNTKEISPAFAWTVHVLATIAAPMLRMSGIAGMSGMARPRRIGKNTSSMCIGHSVRIEHVMYIEHSIRIEHSVCIEHSIRIEHSVYIEPGLKGGQRQCVAHGFFRWPGSRAI